MFELVCETYIHYVDVVELLVIKFYLYCIFSGIHTHIFASSQSAEHNEINN